MSTLSDILDRLTVEGELYEKLPDQSVRCTACGHRCLIREGRRGICQVRFNQGGELRVPWGYVAALQADPIEKKPFFHVHPGSDALTFGMLGCDYHCGYCFPGDTVIITEHGPQTFDEIFETISERTMLPDAEIAHPRGLKAITASGKLRKVKAVFKHPYQGTFIKIKPYYLPELRCTPDHRVFATQDISLPPQPVKACDMTTSHYLAVPRQYHFPPISDIDVGRMLKQHEVTYRVRWDLSSQDRDAIAAATRLGATSRQIGLLLGKDPSYIRHIRSKQARGKADETRTSGAYIENELVRFPNEHRPGVPVRLQLNEDFARLLGYYCAEGSIVQSKKRPNSLVLNFSFSLKETEAAHEARCLLQQILGVNARIVKRETTLAVAVSKASAARLFASLAGIGAREKHVPEILYGAPASVMHAFLEAYVTGDGHRYNNGKISATTVSSRLAYGIVLLALQCGYFASIYQSTMPEEGIILGRRVHRSPQQSTVVWYETENLQRRIIQAEQYHLIPIRSIEQEEFAGDVFNMEVEQEHNYLANFLLVSNCQNWFTSQAMRDPRSNASVNLVRQITPDQMVDLARSSGVQIIASSYNEPLITSEWAVGIFKRAKQAGLKCVYISNGNNTPEVMEYLRPYLVGYKIDLKCMQDHRYRQLGGVLNNVLDGIRRAHDLGLWVEVVTLVVPGFNDSTEELMDAAHFIKSVSPDIPWHVTAFHPDYKMTDPSPTSVKTVLRAAEIGQEAGLNYVYAGNIPGHVGEYEHTFCPNCHTLLVERYSYVILSYHLTPQGACPHCGTVIPGIWPEHPESVRLEGLGMPRPF